MEALARLGAGELLDELRHRGHAKAEEERRLERHPPLRERGRPHVQLLHRRSCSAFQASCPVRPLKQSGGAAAADASTGAAAGSSRVMTNNGSPAESCTSHV